MTLWLAISLGIVQIAVVVVLSCVFHERGWRRGYQSGHEAGCKEGYLRADSWWLGTEEAVKQARRELWAHYGWKERQR